MNMKNICTIFLFLSLCFIVSCGRKSDVDSDGINNNNNPSLRINTASLSLNALSNIQVYAFQGGGGTNNTAFNHRVFNIRQVDDALTMVVPANTWDFVLLSAESGILGQPLVPAVGAFRATSKMWECPSDGTFLLSAPEIVTARTGDITITPGAHETTDVSLTRNVAMIKVVIREVVGMKTNGVHTVSLLDVPKSLTWNGGLYPNKTNPETGSMRASATISDNASLGTQSSNELVFIVPAHQGADFLLETPQDTTTHKLRIAVELEAQAGFTVSKSVELPIVPKANKVLEVNLYVKSDLNVDATIHDWVDHNVSADISHTTLQVSKTNVGLSSRDTIYVNTNAESSYTLESEDTSWLTAVKIDDNRVVLTAKTDSYTDGSPRSAYVNITADNVTKRIKVTQRPDVGTISTDMQSFWVSPSAGNAFRTVTVTSTGPWTIMDPSPATVTHTVTGGIAGSTNVRFDRKEHSGFIPDLSPYYGASTFKIKNTQTLEIVTLTAHNLYLEVDDINLPNVTGQTNTKTNINVYTCMGLSGQFSVESKPPWLTTVNIVAGGNITVSAPGSSDGEEREGTITYYHNDDPTYKVTAKVIQDFFTDIPAFSYFVIKFTWVGSGNATTPKDDAEVWVQFEDTWRSTTPSVKAAFDNIGLGYNSPSSGSSPKYITLTGTSGTFTTLNTSQGLMFWGGDATGGQGETIFFNAPMIDNLDSTYPREIKIVCYTYWFTSGQKDQPIRMSIFAYLDGYMVRSRSKATDTNYTNFSNVGGSLLYSYSRSQKSDKTCSTSEKNVSNMCKTAIITYDRKKHSARVEWTAVELNNPAIPVPDGNPLPPGSNLIYTSSPPRSMDDSQSAADLQKLKESQN